MADPGAAIEEAWDFEDPTGSESRLRTLLTGALGLQGRYEEALAVQTALKAELDAAGTTDPYVDEEIALLRPPDG